MLRQRRPSGSSRHQTLRQVLALVLALPPMASLSQQQQHRRRQLALPLLRLLAAVTASPTPASGRLAARHWRDVCVNPWTKPPADQQMALPPTSCPVSCAARCCQVRHFHSLCLSL
jgi:hypothetical protein